MSNAPCCSCWTIRYVTPVRVLSLSVESVFGIFLLTHCICHVQPPQYKLDPLLARLLGVHTQTRASIMQALWLYIKNNKLQDGHEKEYINCNRYFRQVMKTLENLFCVYGFFTLYRRASVYDGPDLRRFVVMSKSPIN